MKKLPIDIANFETMITQDYVYVDKTKLIYELITQGRLYFLSRPRRFGKSLLISTLKELFSGNRKLFENLWIGKSEYSWPIHPVVHLDLSTLSYQNAEALTADLIWKLENTAQNAGLDITGAPSLGTKLHALLEQLSKRGKVVLLVDEYDYPLLKQIHSIETAKSIREVLNAFFAVVKGLEGEFMRFVFITGVTKFSKASIFSGMNNLNDISLKQEAEGLLGYTEKEIETYFSRHIDAFARARGITAESLRNEMRTWYNGYCFSEDTRERVYNPYSVLYFLSQAIPRFKNRGLWAAASRFDQPPHTCVEKFLWNGSVNY